MICERQDQADRVAWALLTQLGPPAPSPLSQVPFHPGLSVELCTGASVRPQTGAVDARSTWTQHSNHQAEVIAIWFAVVSLACFVLLGTHKKTHIYTWNELHICLDGLRMDTVQTFFPTIHSNKVHFDDLVYISAHHIHHRWTVRHNLCFGTMINGGSSPSDVQTWHIVLRPCQPASYKCVVRRTSSSCCHCSWNWAAPPEWINLTRVWAFFCVENLTSDFM